MIWWLLTCGTRGITGLPHWLYRLCCRWSCFAVLGDGGHLSRYFAGGRYRRVILPLVAYLVVVGLDLRYAQAYRQALLNEYFLGGRSMGGIVARDDALPPPILAPVVWRSRRDTQIRSGGLGLAGDDQLSLGILGKNSLIGASFVPSRLTICYSRVTKTACWCGWQA